MPTYFERLKTGMRKAEEVLQEFIPDATCEWGPMDNHAFYPLWLARGRAKTIVHRFSKEALVGMSQDPPDSRVLDSFRQSIAPFVQR